jgi:hypothetical protein
MSVSHLLKVPVQNIQIYFGICVVEHGNHGYLLWGLQARVLCVAPYCLERNLLLEKFVLDYKLSEFTRQFL